MIKKGQILVITLLVLTILAVILIGVIIIITRDTTQVVTNRKKEEIYSVSENLLRDFVNRFGSHTKKLSIIESDTLYGQYCDSNASFTEVTCILDFSFSEQQSILPIDSEITVIDVKQIIGKERSKDTPLDISLENYKESVSITWDSPAAMEFLLVYFDTKKGTFETIVDTYNLDTVLDSPVVSGPLNHVGAIPLAPIGGTTRGVSINLANIPPVNTCADCKYISLTITPRLLDSAKNIKISVIPSNLANFPVQERIIRVKSQDLFDATSPVVEIETETYKIGNQFGFWNYSILTDSILQN